MKQMKTLTMPNGVTYEIVDDKARKDLVSLESGNRRDCVAPIVHTASGNAIAVDDSSDRPVRNLKLFGKTTQVVTTGAQLFDKDAIIPNTYVTVEEDGVITIDCDNTAGTGDKYAPFYTPVSSLLTPNTDYALVAEVFSTSNVGEKLYITSHHGDENIQFTSFESFSPVSLGVTVVNVKTTNSFDNCMYMCRSFMMIPAGKRVQARLRFSVRSDVGVTADTFVYEHYTAGIASPCPDYPQELVSVENATVTVLGKNLLPYPYSFGSEVGAVETKNGATFMNIGDGGISFYGTPTDYAAVTLISNLKLLHDVSIALVGTYTNVTLEVNIYTKDHKSLGGISNANGITIRKSDYPDGSGLQIAIKRRVNGSAMTGIGYPIAVAGTTIPTEYERYVEPKSMTINRTLSGIPVDSGGNYIDANGQQWVCDEIDLERKVYVERIGTVTFDGSSTTGWRYTNTYGTATRFDYTSTDVVLNSNVYANYFREIIISTPDIEGINTHSNSSYIQMQILTSRLESADIAGLAAYFATNPLTINYIHKTPIETPLTAEELAAFDTLYTHKTNTTVLNDQGAWMEMEYSVDVKTYIDRNSGMPSAEQIEDAVTNYLTNNPVSAGSTAAIGTVNLLASKWVGSGNLHSQVVSINGVTENSQVDLTPSVEQLLVFYEKDLTFVTANDDGVVTVYVIGQKPTNDYSVQVTITEVKR